MTESLSEHIAGCTTIPAALRAVSEWMESVLNAASHAYSEGHEEPEFQATPTSSAYKIVYEKSGQQTFWFLERSILDLVHTPKRVAAELDKVSQVDPLADFRPLAQPKPTITKEAMAELAKKTPDDLSGLHRDLDQLTRAQQQKQLKKQEDEASVRLVNNLNKIITKYLDVGEALGLVGHDRGLIAAELFSDGETRQTGKSHKAVMRKIENLRDDNHGHVKEDALLSLREKCQELETDVAVWRYELLDIAKNLGVIDDDSAIKDRGAAKTIGPSVGAKCYEMRTKIKQCETELATLTQELALERDRSTRMQKTIDEQRSALNNANQQIEYLRTELAKGHEANTKLALEMQYRSTAAHQGMENTARNYEDALRIIGELYIENRHLKTQESNE